MSGKGIRNRAVRVLCAGLSACMFLGMTGCAQKEEKPAGNIQAEPTVTSTLTLTLNEDDGKLLAQGMNQFAFHLYDRMEHTDNLFYSPYSIATALSMLNVGADGDTKAQLEGMLGITDYDAWNKAVGAYLQKEWTDKTFLTTANAVWMDENKEWSENIEEDFLKPVANYYQGMVRETDIRRNPTDTAAQVNDWVKTNTRGMIPTILTPEQITPDICMMLLNAVYFEGKWRYAFDPEKTREETFHGTKGDVQTDLMNQYDESYTYAEYGDFKGVALPYRADDETNSSVVMKAFLPLDESKDATALFAALSDEEKLRLLSSLDSAGREELERLAIPKFTMEQGIDGLDAILKDLGMTRAYEWDADFDRICEDVYVSSVIHKAKIEVDEQGTKAAAATVIMMTDECAMFVEEPKTFIANRPFVFVLQDIDTGIILFMGQMCNP